MSPIRQLLSSKSKAFIPYLTAGDPSLQVTKDLLFCLEKSGATLIELGIPFSDPSADGECLQRSAERALRAQFKLKDFFVMLRQARNQGLTCPLVLFGYLNSFSQYGFEKLRNECTDLSIQGLLILDLPSEASVKLNDYMKSQKVSLIYLVSPTTSNERLQLINQLAQGFVYCVARTGVTGPRTEVDGELTTYLENVKKYISKPLALGFGLSSPEQLEGLFTHCDAFVFGSVLMGMVEAYGDDKNILENKIEGFSRSIASKILELNQGSCSC